MSRNWFYVSLLLILGTTAMLRAQTAPQFEVFGGFSYLRADLAPDNADRVNGYGWDASFSEYTNRWFGATADFSQHFWRPTFNTVGGTVTNVVNVRTTTAMFGPTFAIRKSEKFQPFGRVLLGVMQLHTATTSKAFLLTGIPPYDISNTKFAYGVGGGVDFKLSRSFAVRGTADWIRSNFVDGFDDRQNHVRASVGLVYRWGSR